MGKVVVIHPDKEPETLERADLSLQEAQLLVGDGKKVYVQAVKVHYDGAMRLMLVDEDGLEHNAAHNFEATLLMHATHGGPVDVILGTAIILIDIPSWEH